MVYDTHMDTQQNRQSAGKISLQWLAGFVDGEGCIRVQSRKVKHGKKWYVPEISVSNTDLKTMEEISLFLKEKNIGHHLENQSLKRTTECGYKPQYRLMIAGLKRGKKFLEILSPHLVTKRQQAEVLKEFIEYRLSVPQNTPYSEKEDLWAKELSDLKKR
jgi:hypothetical protein